MFKCMECGKRFRTTKAAERASLNGCPGCGGVDIDLDVESPQERAVKLCQCGSGLPSWWEKDGNGIPLCRVCQRCQQEKLSHYRPEILRPYTAEDVDEPIDPDGDTDL
jgi:hypothetical protein